MLAAPRATETDSGNGAKRLAGVARDAANDASAGAGSQQVSDKAPARRSHLAPIPDANATPAPKLPKPAKRKGGGGAITPEQALANTRALLAAKQQKAHQPPPYPVDDPIHHGHATTDAMAQIANERHLEEANKPAVQGHIASQDRASQGKRDGRD